MKWVLIAGSGIVALIAVILVRTHTIPPESETGFEEETFVVQEREAEPTVSSGMSEVTIEPSPGTQIYHNKEWGFAFEYPEGWKIRENVIMAVTSLFSVYVEPEQGKHLPRPVFINVVTSDWGKLVISRRSEERIKDQVKVGGMLAHRHESSDMSIPMESYFLPVNDTYWINIAGKHEYEDVLEQVVSSFRFIE